MAGVGVVPLRNLVRAPIELIVPHPDNVREHLGPLDDLAMSIRSVGLLQPLVCAPVNKKFWIVAGHRRFAACKIAGLREVPIIVREELIDERACTEAMLVENLHRVDLSPIEEARAMSRLQEDCGLTQNEIAARLGVSNYTVSRRLLLLTLPVELQGRLSSKQITIGEAIKAAQLLKGRAPHEVDRGWDAPSFCSTHPLAPGVKARCEALGHGLRRRFGGVGCGECWEALIRMDERDRCSLGQAS